MGEPSPVLVFDNHGDCTPESLNELLASEPYGGDRARPYNGQPWTDTGARGRALVTGITMRDVGDCIARAAAIVGTDVDLALIQNTLCEVERMMGIFPNVPKLSTMEIPMLMLGNPPARNGS